MVNQGEAEKAGPSCMLGKLVEQPFDYVPSAPDPSARAKQPKDERREECNFQRDTGDASSFAKVQDRQEDTSKGAQRQGNHNA